MRVSLRGIVWGWIVASTCALASTAIPKEFENVLCPQVTVRGPELLKFTDPETKLVCGDPKNPAWKNIPLEESLYQLKVFLQKRGYQHPKILERETRLVVDAGEATILRQVLLDGAPPELVFTEYRGVLGRKLTPENLDEIESWIKRHLQFNGYPCPKLVTQADPDTGIMRVAVTPGEKHSFGRIVLERTAIPPEVLTRYNAFRAQDPFDQRLLTLTERRTTDDGVAQSTYFTADCQRPEFVVRQKVIEGSSREVTLGVGFDTEQLFIASAAWNANRLGAFSSQATLQASASFRKQELVLSSRWHLMPEIQRYFLAPSLDIKHDNDPAYDDIVTQLRVAPSINLDFVKSSLNLSGGPSLSRLDTRRGVGPLGVADYTYVSFDATSELRSHDFEYYLAAPLTGYRVFFRGNFNSQALLSRVTAQKFSFAAEHLGNFNNFDPPEWVLGLRFTFDTTLPGEQYQNLQTLPVTLRQYLGGSDNIRGFRLHELPFGNQGAMSAAYAGIELRYKEIVSFEPLLFLDLAALGDSFLSVTPPYYGSVGTGVRWKTVVGAVRATFARGFVYGADASSLAPLTHWQFFVSLGEEF